MDTFGVDYIGADYTYTTDDHLITRAPSETGYIWSIDGTSIPSENVSTWNIDANLIAGFDDDLTASLAVGPTITRIRYNDHYRWIIDNGLTFTCIPSKYVTINKFEEDGFTLTSILYNGHCIWLYEDPTIERRTPQEDTHGFSQEEIALIRSLTNSYISSSLKSEELYRKCKELVDEYGVDAGINTDDFNEVLSGMNPKQLGSYKLGNYATDFIDSYTFFIGECDKSDIVKGNRSILRGNYNRSNLLGLCIYIYASLMIYKDYPEIGRRLLAAGKINENLSEF